MRGTALSIRWFTPFRILLLGIAGYSAFLLALSVLRYQDLLDQTYDLGVMIQAYSSGSHGHWFLENPDLVTRGVPSLLDIHFSWVLFGVLPIYDVAPSVYTLFAIQSIVLGIAALPLYLLTVDLSSSAKKGLLAAGLYLLWAPLISGSVSAFHFEVFLPVELFSMFLFWSRKRYGVTLGFVVLACFTIDAGPLFPFVTAVFFLSFGLQDAWRATAGGQPTGSSGGLLTRLAARCWRLLRSIRLLLKSRPAQFAVAIACLSVVLFFVGRILSADFTGWVIGPGPSLGITRVRGASIANFSADTNLKLLYWLAIFASVGFLPFRRPRFLILIVPWIGYTWSETANWWTIGYQYADLIAYPLFIGFSYAITGMTFWPFRNSSPSNGSVAREGPRGRSIPPAENSKPRRIILSQARAVSMAGTLLVVFAIGFNIALNPLSPATDNLNLGPGYALQYPPPPGFSQAEHAAALVPAGATVAASARLFPLVASIPGAYPLIGKRAYYPFKSNPHDYPDFVFVSTSEWVQLGTIKGFEENVTNWSLFGVRAWVPQTDLGSLFLLERGYSGQATMFGPPVAVPGRFTPGSAMQAGARGIYGNTTGTPKSGSKVIESDQNTSGVVWSIQLPGAIGSGSYSVTVWAKSLNRSINKDEFLSLTVVNFTTNPSFTIGRAVLQAEDLPQEKWVPLVFNFTLSYPVYQLTIDLTTLPLAGSIAYGRSYLGVESGG